MQNNLYPTLGNFVPEKYDPTIEDSYRYYNLKEYS